MNYAKYIKSGFLSLAVFAAGGMTSCENTLDLGTVNDGDYGIVGDVYGYLRDVDAQRVERTVTLYDGTEASAELYLGLTKTVGKAVDVELRVDADYVAEYNKAHKTDFALYPSLELVEIERQGATTVAPGESRSETVTVTLSADENVVPGKTYILPVTAEIKTEGVKLSSTGKRYVFLIRNAGAVPDTTKGSVKTVLYFETNDTNPLNALEFKMKNSGKLFWDYVILFAANINYNEDTGRVYVKNNENIQFLLDNREQYIKPLQDAGIKVLLGILGNHDDAGIAQLTDAVARDFAQELKAIVEACHLDGVNFDDEWSNENPSGPGFVTPSPAAAARMCYETKRAMPDKLVSVFMWGQIKEGFSNVFDGYLPGDYVDIALPNYGAVAYPGQFPGLTISHCAGNAIELRRAPYAREADIRQMREDGFGYQMDFALFPGSYDRQVPCLQTVAKGLYDDELVAPQYGYRKNETKRILLSEF